MSHLALQQTHGYGVGERKGLNGAAFQCPPECRISGVYAGIKKRQIFFQLNKRLFKRCGVQPQISSPSFFRFFLIALSSFAPLLICSASCVVNPFIFSSKGAPSSSGASVPT